jgi:hypothetical protein
MCHGTPPDWSPAIGTALKAGYRWLDVYCAGCRQMKPVANPPYY